jgi:hypothetical protein
MELRMLSDATSEIESVTPEQKIFCYFMCLFRNLSFSQKVEFIEGCGEGTLEKTSR